MKEQMDNFYRRQREEVEAVRGSQREDLEALWLSLKDEMALVVDRLAENVSRSHLSSLVAGRRIGRTTRKHQTLAQRSL